MFCWIKYKKKSAAALSELQSLTRHAASHAAFWGVQPRQQPFEAPRWQEFSFPWELH